MSLNITTTDVPDVYYVLALTQDACGEYKDALQSLTKWLLMENTPKVFEEKLILNLQTEIEKKINHEI